MSMTPQDALKEAIEFFGKWDDPKGQALAEALRKLQSENDKLVQMLAVERLKGCSSSEIDMEIKRIRNELRGGGV